MYIYHEQNLTIFPRVAVIRVHYSTNRAGAVRDLISPNRSEFCRKSLTPWKTNRSNGSPTSRPNHSNRCSHGHSDRKIWTKINCENSATPTEPLWTASKMTVSKSNVPLKSRYVKYFEKEQNRWWKSSYFAISFWINLKFYCRNYYVWNPNEMLFLNLLVC